MILCFLDLGLVRMVSSVFQRERERGWREKMCRLTRFLRWSREARGSIMIQVYLGTIA